MKVVFVTSGQVPMPPVEGGAVETLLDAFLKYNEENNIYNITVYGGYNQRAVECSKKYINTEFIFIKKNKFQKIYDLICRILNKLLKKIYVPNSYIMKVTRMLKHQDVDVVVVENTPMFGLALRKVSKKKLILHLHNDYINISSKLNDKIINSYDDIYVVSNYLKQKIDEVKLTDKIKVLYNGVDLKKFSKLNNTLIDEVKKEFNIKQDDKIILYTGRIVREKGISELIAAYSLLSYNKNLKLLIVGDINSQNKKHMQYYEEILASANMSKNKIIFTGKKDYADIPIYYSMADVGVVPSICEEGFALTVVENMALGNKLVISDSGGMVELVDDNTATIVKRDENYVSNLSKAIESAIADKRDVELIKQQAQKYSNEIYCKKFHELLKGEIYNEG